MLRVSSRQRLVSWDAFDAAAPADDDHHRYGGDFDFGSGFGGGVGGLGADYSSYDADADSIADYESCCYETTTATGTGTTAPSSRRGSLQGCGWSFDHSERAAAAAASHEEDVLMPALRAAADSVVVADDTASPDPPGPPPRQVAVLVPPTPSSSAGRKRDRDFYDLPTTTLPTAPLTPTTSGASSGMKKVVSFSTLPASEEEPPQPRGQGSAGPQQQLQQNQLQLQRPLSQRTPSDASLCRYMSVNSLCDMALAPSSTAVTLPTLADDVLLLISSYMVPADVRSLSASCRSLRTVVMGKGAHHLWVEMTARRWDLISRLRGRAEAGRRRIEFRDGIDVPVAGVEKKTETNIAESAAAIVAGSGSEQPEEEAERHKVVNASALLGLSAANHPTEIRLDGNVTAGRRDVPRFRKFEMTAAPRQQQQGTTPRVRSEVVIQFTGRVGTGDRSVLADCPLPKPVGGALVVPPSDAEVTPGSNGAPTSGGLMSAGRSYKWSPRLSPLPSPQTALMELLRRSGSTVLSRQGSSSLSASSTDNNKRRGGGRARRPFVSPYVVASSAADRGEEADVVVVDLTPRLVSYYEVTVLSRDVAQEPPAPSSVPPDQRRDEGFRGAARPSLLRRDRRSTEFGGAAERDGGNGLGGGGFGGHAERGGGLPAMPPLHLPPAAMAAAMAMPPLPDPDLFPHPRAPAAGGGPDQQPPQSSADNNDCVAVGLSTSRFRPSSKMPGWDVHSYGYHGDDGGAFHGAGDMERVFGPKYGVGDTVGCGVDYSSSSSSGGESSGGGGGIFFTLNGEFLGYAWTDVPALEEGEDLYPTVGVDTNCPLSVNFGDRPFEFDLAGFTAGHAEEVAGSLGGLVVGRRRRRGAEDGREDGGGGKGGGEEVCGSSSKIDDWGEEARGVGSLPPLSSSRHGSIMAMRGGGGLRRSRMFRGLSA